MLTIFKKLFGKSEKKNSALPATTAPLPQQTQFESSIQMAKVEVARLSLKAIASKFPEDIRALLNHEPDENTTVALPIQTILKQLPTGVVRMSFASLHRQAPAGLFKALPTGDKRMVEVPLVEIFRHVKPTALKRRNDQRAVVLQEDDELAGPVFNNASAPPVAAEKQKEEPVETPAGNHPEASEATPASSAMRVVAPPSHLQLAGATPQQKSTATSAAPKPSSAPSEPCLTFPLSQLTAGWPDEVLTALAALPPETTVNVPHSCVAPGLARGRISCKWAAFRAWLPNTAKNLQIGDDTDLVLPLKLLAPAFLAASKPAAAPRKSVTVDETIPALFSGGKVPSAESSKAEPPPAAESAPVLAAEALPATPEPAPKCALENTEAPATAPATATAPVEPLPAPPALAEAAPAPSIEKLTEPVPPTPAPTLGDALGVPGKDQWTPAELVTRVAKLNGVAGAVVALQEGFPVAHSLPDDVNPETVAAFLPQIFTRLNQYSGEMKLGEVDDLLFTTRGAHCLIYRLGTVYFAALGQPGSPLPWNELRLVAAELSRQVTK